MIVEQAVEGFRAARGFGEVALKRSGESIEQAPHVPSLKRIMTRLAPFMQYGRDETRANLPAL